MRIPATGRASEAQRGRCDEKSRVSVIDAVHFPHNGRSGARSLPDRP